VLVESARGADLLIVEATLLAAGEDDPKRGHLTVDEAVAIGRDAKVGRTVLVHHRSQNHEAVVVAAQAAETVDIGRPGLVIEVDDIARSADRDGVDHDGGGGPPATLGDTSTTIAAAS
jgi:ribonuclease BN (tRNA processing enzyme)